MYKIYIWHHFNLLMAHTCKINTNMFLWFDIVVVTYSLIFFVFYPVFVYIDMCSFFWTILPFIMFLHRISSFIWIINFYSTIPLYLDKNGVPLLRSHSIWSLEYLYKSHFHHIELVFLWFKIITSLLFSFCIAMR